VWREGEREQEGVNYSDFWCKSRKISVSRGVERCGVECFKRSEARVREVWRGGGEMGV
jgi:hypothetical protein